MSVRRFAADGGMTFSKSIVVEGQGTWIYLSGQVGLGDDGQIVSGGTEAETLRTLEHLIAAVNEAGGTKSDIIRITGYLTSLEDYEGYATARKKVFGDTLPASTAVQVAGLLLGAHVEIDAIAFVPSH
jgi:2-iminobutanoate/2-iminopropanoate deaminase